jgi:hypothetical protein
MPGFAPWLALLLWPALLAWAASIAKTSCLSFASSTTEQKTRWLGCRCGWACLGEKTKRGVKVVARDADALVRLASADSVLHAKHGL